MLGRAWVISFGNVHLKTSVFAYLCLPGSTWTEGGEKNIFPEERPELLTQAFYSPLSNI